ncbi:MAG: hypothetical protein LBQ75_04515 [Zoogloeaceae bacterium]|jgi:hypothetical protein|nr:hypothetical protein [Zoogloeaceae bacterium]
MKKQDGLAGALALVALVAMVIAYFSPIWWVSLTAPNYPADAFPDGIRIHFHFDRVANGCKVAAAGTRMADEIIQGDLSHETERWNPILDARKNIDKWAKGLDCVHEMNTINHYVGMFPIETGAPVERPLAKYFFGFFAVMIVAFILPRHRARMVTLIAGFSAVAVWMLVDQFILGKLDAQVQDYVLAAGTFFKEPDRIAAWGENVRLISEIAIFGLIGSMVIVVIGALKSRGFQLVLPLVPALLPLFFLITYAGWLWFFGHNLHSWAAFTVKPFMPTVFGEGKVAQFSTYSYPAWGYGLLVLIFVCLGLALLIRRKQLREEPGRE